MKELLAFFSGLALVLSMVACTKKPDPTPQEVEAEKQTQLKEILMKRDKKAEFTVEATYGDHCKIGEMSWYETDTRTYPNSVRAVICDNANTTTIQYRSGKRTVEQVSIDYSKEELQTAIKKKEELEAKEKADALEKLTEREKEMLGLK
jgi:hypothetical protein